MKEKELCELIDPIVKNAGFIIHELKFGKQNNDYVLSLVVDRASSISLDDLVKLDELLTPALDEVDYLPSNYALEITSLGAEKPISIDKIKDYVGNKVNVVFKNAVNGHNKIEGILKEADEQKVKLSYKEKTRNKELIVEITNIQKIRLAI